MNNVHQLRLHGADVDALFPLSQSDIDRHIARKFAADLAAAEAEEAAAGLAPISRPALPQDAIPTTYRQGYADGITVGSEQAQREEYVSGWRWGWVCGAMSAGLVALLSVAAYGVMVAA